MSIMQGSAWLWGCWHGFCGYGILTEYQAGMGSARVSGAGASDHKAGQPGKEGFQLGRLGKNYCDLKSWGGTRRS